jgi:hypothetical protein
MILNVLYFTNTSTKHLASVTGLKGAGVRTMFKSVGNHVPETRCRTLLRVKSSPVTGLEWPRGFQEVKVPRLHDNGTGWW